MNIVPFALLLLMTVIVGFLEVLWFYNTILMLFGFILIAVSFISFILTLDFVVQGGEK